MNLRTHRKILVADGRVGLTGGMNIRVGHCLKGVGRDAFHSVPLKARDAVESVPTPPPFDHSKLMLVDGGWVLLSSANWDPRSLRLNFEYNLECYDLDLARRLEEVVVSKLKTAHFVTLQEVDARWLPVRLCDSIARLLTPYL